ncbi:Probable carboxylesterase 2 [Linum perenne]
MNLIFLRIQNHLVHLLLLPYLSQFTTLNPPPPTNSTMAASDSNQPQIATEFPGMITIYTNGTIHRLRDTDFIPPSSSSGVSSKDVIFLPDSNLSARIYLPDGESRRKLPLVLYFHGGGFCIASPFCAKYHRYASRIAAESQSVQPTRTHGAGNGPEPWLNEFADFNRIFLAGDSAGGNIVHNLAMAAGNPDYGLEVDLLGAALVHPYFWGSEPIGSESVNHLPEAKAGANSLWPFICPSNPDNDDPRVNPVAEDGPGLVGLGCRRVLVCVAEKDVLRDRGWMYYQALGRSGWMGVVEMDECEDEGHGFHLYNLDSENAEILIKRLAAFFNRDMPPLAY